ncbi:MAG: hypothetical protein KF777_23210 [Planctomycetaceae bacterium]|nr:hypothetical protein [Planctomycetaceae bacterium]
MENPSNIAGFQGELEPSVSPDGPRPLSMEWISDDLLRATLAAWSARYGRSLSQDEAVEILMNVKRFSEALMNHERREDK